MLDNSWHPTSKAGLESTRDGLAFLPADIETEQGTPIHMVLPIL